MPIIKKVFGVYGPNDWRREKAENEPVWFYVGSGEEYWFFKGVVYGVDEDARIHFTEDQIKSLILKEQGKNSNNNGEWIFRSESFKKLGIKFDVQDKNNSISRSRLPENVRREVWRRDDGKCVRCGSREKLEYDHIIPIAKGGSNTARNIELLCEKCNRSKSDNIR